MAAGPHCEGPAGGAAPRTTGYFERGKKGGWGETDQPGFARGWCAWAFTWDALDRLLEEEEIEIAAMSGTSAGALNGEAVKAELVQDRRTAARENLEWF